MKLVLKLTNRVSLGVFVVGLAAAGILSTYQASNASALSARDFNAGRIIDDTVFYDKNSMSAGQIQDFLNRLIPNCDTWGTNQSEYGGGTRAQYAASRGWHSPPYVCLNNYHENPTTRETSFEKGGGAFAGGISAAQIIYNAAQQYGISPKVLLVLLKKESAGPLTSDSWPLKSQYKYAMGYACPDSGPGYSANCDADKSGFYNQIMLAAWQLKYYKDHPNDYRYGIGMNSIQYSPDPACGTKQVNIENIATLSLYIYTPYVPNDGALANYPGTAPCGAYGNRNFFMFFNEWFGSTYFAGGYEIMKKYNTMGGSNSWLGQPVTDIRSIGNTGTYQVYEGGKIYWKNGLGAFAIRNGDINDHYASIGYQSGYLGFPTSDEIPIANRGSYQRFERGQLYWSEGTKALSIRYGAMFNRYAELGYQNGYLGFPTSRETSTGQGVYQSFQGGRLYWRSDSRTIAMDMTNEISVAYDAAGSSKAYMGMPNRSTICGIKNGGCWMNFDGGKIYWSENTGAFEVRYGAVNNEYAKFGYQNGQLGYPISREQPTGEKCGTSGNIKQDYEHGTIYWSRCANPTTSTTLTP